MSAMDGPARAPHGAASSPSDPLPSRAMKKLLIVAAAVAALAAAGTVLTQRADAAEVPVHHPTRLAHVGDAQQLVVVTGVSRTSTHATLRTYQQDVTGTWWEPLPVVPARIGYGGWVPAA